MGSGSTSALSRPALVYSLRRLEASTVYLPAPGAGGAFERADYVGCDPTPVEVLCFMSLTWLYSPAAHEVLLVFDLLRLYGSLGSCGWRERRDFCFRGSVPVSLQGTTVTGPTCGLGCRRLWPRAWPTLWLKCSSGTSSPSSPP